MTSSAQAASVATLAPCLARQPILTKDEKVLGYDVLLGETSDDLRPTSGPGHSPSSVIDVVKHLGLDVVCDNHLAFIPCTQQMLLHDAFHALPHDKVVVEIPPDLAVSASAIEACERLRRRGYKIAIDNLRKGDDRELLVPFADFLEVDLRLRGVEDCVHIAATHARKPYKLLAQHVDSRLELKNAEKAGFTLFQGYFFHHPEQMRVRQIPASQASKLRLLQAISASEIDFTLVEELIRQDASLCYRLMRYLNSPVIGLATQVQSVRQAINLLGEQAITRWIRTATALSMGQPKCSELVLASLVRARFCELISPKVDRGGVDLFLVGMFSLMDAILETPMGVLLEGIAFDPHAKAVLLAIQNGGGTRLSPVCDLMAAREKGDWERVTTHATKLKLSLPFVNRAYIEAMQWAHELTKSSNTQRNTVR